MSAANATRVCSNCKAKVKSVYGHCRFCGKEVCTACGTQQVSQVDGKFYSHNACFEINPAALKTSFRFIKIKKFA